jgi:hypothetical protein
MVLNLRPKCANPACAASFEWLAGGSLFRFRRDASAQNRTTESTVSGASTTAHYWLCDHCSNIYTLHYDSDRGVQIVPLWPELPVAEDHMHLPAR